MRTGLLLLLLLSPTLVACDGGGFLDGDPTPPPGPGPTPEPVEVEIETEDRWVLRGTWAEAADASRNPAVLLLHQFGPNDDPGCSVGRHDRSDWDVVAEDFVAAGISTLALDFRDHGASDATDVSSTCDLLSDRERLPQDVQAALDWLQARPLIVDRDRIGVAGVSVGANLTLTTANRSRPELTPGWGASAFVSISARVDRAEDFDPQGDESLELNQTLLIVAEDEEPQASQNQELFDENQFLTNSNAILIRPGAAHGAELLDDDGDVQEAVVSWFVDLWAG